jgi:PAS domain S-box-containing protein
MFSNNPPNLPNPWAALLLKQELQLAKSLMNYAANAVFWLQPDAQLFYVNDAACHLLEYSQNELLSLTFHDIDPDLSVNIWVERWRSLKQQGSLSYESQYRTKTGRLIPVGIVLLYLKRYGREFSCAFVHEMTTEIELRQTLETEQQISELREHFVLLGCHEVRTLLNITSLSASLLKRYSQQWTEEKKQLHLEHVQTSIEQINQLINEVLMIGKVKPGQLKFEPKLLDLDAFCRDLVTQIQLTSSNAITFTNQISCSIVSVDKNFLQLILKNLLTNAIKYSPSGGAVELQFFYRDGKLVFQVKDTGIGIPTDDLERLFELFHRGSNVGKIPGTGMGLAIVKRLVDLHQGQIYVTSEVGKGTTFTVILPSVLQAKFNR